MKQRLHGAETRLARLRAAIEAGVDPVALVEAINDAQAQRAAAQAELDTAKPAVESVSDAEIYAMVDALGDVGASLSRADPEKMRRIYEQMRLEMVYHSEDKAVDVSIRPLGGVVRVRGGT